MGAQFSGLPPARLHSLQVTLASDVPKAKDIVIGLDTSHSPHTALVVSMRSDGRVRSDWLLSDAFFDAL